MLRRAAVAEGLSQPNLLVATHNQASIEHTLATMSELGIPPNAVSFGQLYGMSDHLTLTLGANGYEAYKYVPYGPLHEVQQNSRLCGALQRAACGLMPGTHLHAPIVIRTPRSSLWADAAAGVFACAWGDALFPGRPGRYCRT